MKKFWIVLSILMLCGCSANPAGLQNSLNQKIKKVIQQPAMCIADNHKTLFSYYAEPSVGRIESTMTSNVFLIDNTEVVMNLDISSVINTKYYPDVLTEPKANGDEIVFISGQMGACDGNQYDYSVSVYLLNNGKYYVDVQTHYVNFYSAVDYVMIDDIVIHMLKIARSVEVNELEVIIYYSSKPADEHQREQVDLFQQEIAESGRLDELLGGVDAGHFEEDEPVVDDPVEDMPDIWMDEFIEE